MTKNESKKIEYLSGGRNLSVFFSVWKKWLFKKTLNILYNMPLIYVYILSPDQFHQMIKSLLPRVFHLPMFPIQWLFSALEVASMAWGPGLSKWLVWSFEGTAFNLGRQTDFGHLAANILPQEPPRSTLIPQKRGIEGKKKSNQEMTRRWFLVLKIPSFFFQPCFFRTVKGLGKLAGKTTFLGTSIRLFSGQYEYSYGGIQSMILTQNRFLLLPPPPKKYTNLIVFIQKPPHYLIVFLQSIDPFPGSGTRNRFWPLLFNFGRREGWHNGVENHGNPHGARRWDPNPIHLLGSGVLRLLAWFSVSWAALAEGTLFLGSDWRSRVSRGRPRETLSWVALTRPLSLICS